MTTHALPLAAVSPTLESSRSPVEWLSDLVPLAEPRWLVEGLVPAGGLIAMIGPPSAGKTFLAIDLAVHVASGRDWLGRRTARGLVIYVGAEDPAGLRMRLIAARDHHQVGQGSPLAFHAADLNLLRAEDARTLIAIATHASATAQLPVSLLIIDTLSRTFGDGDENGADMAAYVRQLAALQSRFNCAVMVLHHPPKSPLSRTPRGHSSLPAACDTLFAVTGGKSRRLIVEKQRNGPADFIIGFKLRPIDSALLSTCVIEQTGPSPSIEDGRRNGNDDRVILNVLAELQDQKGRAPPSDVQASIQSNIVVPMRLWEDTAIGSLRSPSRQPDSSRRAFQRARKRLVEDGTIGTSQNWVWIVE